MRIDLPRLFVFVFADSHRGDGVLGSRLPLPVHPPQRALGLRAQKVHPLLCLDPRNTVSRTLIRHPDHLRAPWCGV